MTGMFPNTGVPAADAKNSIDAKTTTGCDELWFSTSRCQPRFDPAAANAQMAEILNLINCFGGTYDCSVLDNLCRELYKVIDGAYPRGQTFFSATEQNVPNNTLGDSKIVYNKVFSLSAPLNGGIDAVSGAGGLVTVNKTGMYMMVSLCRLETVVSAAANVTTEMAMRDQSGLVRQSQINSAFPNGADTDRVDLNVVTPLMGMAAGTVNHMEVGCQVTPAGSFTSCTVKSVQWSLTSHPQKTFL